MNHKRHNYITYLLFVLAIGLLLIGSIIGNVKGNNEGETNYPKELPVAKTTGQAQGELLRFHVLANSDEKEDQQLKNEVKEVLVNYLKNKLAEVDNLAEAKEVITAEMANIEKIAEKEIIARGYSYQVTGEIGVYSFPTRMYGDTIFPAGEYEAVRIIIGQGQGENWWCVLFPALCFIEGTSLVTETASQPQGVPVSHDAPDDETDNSNQPVIKTDSAAKTSQAFDVQVKFKVVELVKALLSNFRKTG